MKAALPERDLAGPAARVARAYRGARPSRSLRLALGALSLAATALLAAVAAPACRSVVGADEEYVNAADDFCLCSGNVQGVFNSPEECIATVTKRLKNADREQVGDWLEKYVNTCAKDCPASVACYYTQPVCSVGECTKAEECCSFDGGAGACTNSQCAPLP